MWLSLVMLLGSVDYCARPSAALDWEPGVDCPLGTWDFAVLNHAHTAAWVGCQDKETRRRRGPWVIIDCNGVVLERSEASEPSPVPSSEPSPASELSPASDPSPASGPSPASEPSRAPSAEAERSEVHIALGLPINLGAAVEVSRAPAVTTYTMSFRPEIFMGAAHHDVGVGLYAEVLTLRKFSDILVGGGIDLAFRRSLVDIRPGVGASARWDTQRWGAVLSTGLFVGVRGGMDLLALPAGLRVELRQQVTPAPMTTLLFLVELDALWPFLLPFFVLGGNRPWFPHG